jgi:sulfur transfer protein SufE
MSVGRTMAKEEEWGVRITRRLERGAREEGFPDNERQLQDVLHELRSRVWRLANVQAKRIHINTDTTSSIMKYYAPNRKKEKSVHNLGIL